VVEVKLFFLEASTQELPGCSLQPGRPGLRPHALPLLLVPTNVDMDSLGCSPRNVKISGTATPERRKL